MALLERQSRTRGGARFGVFEVDFDSREIRRRGVRLNLQEKPFRILEILIEAGNRLVTRKQLIAELWPGTYVDFDRSLNTAVNVLRQTLSDSPRRPRFLETRVGIGYRFIASVEWVPGARHGPQWLPEIDSIAVLPFENSERDSELEYLARGIPESLIRSLSAIDNLRIIARSASFHYGTAGIDACAAGRELKAARVLSGRVSRRSDSISIDVELADARTGTRLWGDFYQRTAGDLLQIEDRIAQEIAGKLRSELSHEEKTRLDKCYTTNSDAYHLYLRGQYLASRMAERSLAASLAQFEAALRIDPHYALAHAGLANVYSLHAFLNVRPARELLPKAKEHAIKALWLDNELAEGHAALAGVMKIDEWNWAGAELEYRRALDLNPNYASGHRFYADHLSATGRHQEALSEMETARRLDPLSLVINMELAWILYVARDYAGAVERAQQTLELEPRFAPALHGMGLAYEQLGRHSAARDALLSACELAERHPAALAALAHACASARDTTRAEEILHELEAASSHRYVSPYCLAFALLAIGMKERAIASLKAACEDRDVWLAWLLVDPRFDPLRSDSRFRKIVRRVGLAG